MKKCTNCGLGPISEDANYCPQCGVRVGAPRVPEKFCRTCGRKLLPNGEPRDVQDKAEK